MNRLTLLFLCIVLLTGCSATLPPQADEILSQRPIEKYVDPNRQYPVDVYDPWEGFNRPMYYFNAKFDQYVFLPVVDGYEFITPDFLEQGISNFFLNLTEFRNFSNSLLQLKGKSTLKALGRFVVNSTIGIAGLFDPATPLGINRQNEDFGQTLGHYGVGNGPFLVLPIFGPSNLRDTTGLITDTVVRQALYSQIDPLDEHPDKEVFEVAATLLQGIDARHRLAFRYYETGSPFEYELIRLIYTKMRWLEIEK
jgi:phospholipid-binding lipoprotein MlaA